MKVEKLELLTHKKPRHATLNSLNIIMPIIKFLGISSAHLPWAIIMPSMSMQINTQGRSRWINIVVSCLPMDFCSGAHINSYYIFFRFSLTTELGLSSLHWTFSNKWTANVIVKDPSTYFPRSVAHCPPLPIWLEHPLKRKQEPLWHTVKTGSCWVDKLWARFLVCIIACALLSVLFLFL